MLFTLFGNKSIRYEGASPFTILYIKVNFLICLLSAKFSHPVSKYRERKEAKIGSPATMLAALSCICSNRKLFVAFPWVETSTGPGGFIICVFII